MFNEFMRNRREKKYLKEYKELAERPFCFQYEFFKELKQRAHDDMIKDKISLAFYDEYFITRDFREILAKLLTK
jgi:hypothetical protein